MGGKDHCAVNGCKNSRHHPGRLVRKDHIGILRWHGPRSKDDMESWEKMLNRNGFKVTMGTKVCSNHFKAGYCSDVCPIPTLYMQGYGVESPIKRNARSNPVQPPPKKTKTCHDDNISEDNNQIYASFINDHDYNKELPTAQKFERTVSKCNHCCEKSDRIIELTNIIVSQEKRIEELKKELDFAIYKVPLT